MYAGLQDTVAKLLKEFGQSVTLTKPDYTGDNQGFDPETGTYVPVEGEEAGDAESTTVKAVFVGIGYRWKDKFAIETGDSIALVSADGTEPEQNDLIDGWTILAVEKVKPAATTVLYKCHVRKQ
jgi:hypothetical protein